MKKLCVLGACFFGFFAISYADAPVNPGCFEKEKALVTLETAENLLIKARDSFPSCKENVNLSSKSECNGSKPLAYMEISRKLISDVRRSFPAYPKPIEKDVRLIKAAKLMDCSEILASGHNESGVYTLAIQAEDHFSSGKTVQFYCDMMTASGGWTVIQRRGKFPIQQDFYLGWESYKNGFGNLTEEFWFGNEKIQTLCQKGCEIRFDLENVKGDKGFALYQNFKLSGNKYNLEISGYTGNVGDSMKVHNNINFSTKDQGHEKATMFKGGWWYKNDNHDSNLNGIYQPGKSDYDSVFWYTWRAREGLASVEIKVRPKKI